MFGKKPSKPQNRIDSLIGAGTRIEGNLTFIGGLRVDGEVKGNVVAAADQPSTLVISEHAKVEGEIHVSHLVINGSVTGPVHSGEFLELQAHSRVLGDVHYNTLEMHLGAIVEGRLVHRVASEGKTVELKLASSNN
ncbi:MAG: polymer-forming cytoskeletal protein [Proteobacteria bacterium]|nr:polymer-forming cytoskeletal protein [Pseudomonadota bacterium]